MCVYIYVCDGREASIVRVEGRVDDAEPFNLFSLLYLSRKLFPSRLLGSTWTEERGGRGGRGANEAEGVGWWW